MLLQHGVSVRLSVSMPVYVCMSSVTLGHTAKAAERNEMPFGRDTRVVSNNIVLDRGPSSPTRRGDLRAPVKTALQIVAKPLQILEWLL